MSGPAAPHPLSRSLEDWQAVLDGWGERPFRARQICRWIYGRGVLEPGGMTDLPQALRERLAADGLGPPGRVAHVHRSRDGTRKLLIELADGARVECVLIPMTREVEALDADAGALDEDDEEEPSSGDARQRVTLCLSTQYGCAMGCVFCASGRAGLQRGLTAAEVLTQILLARDHLEPGEVLRNLVFMGMGEPLHHYEETKRALQLIIHPDGLGMSPRRVTVSTVGLVPGIEKLGRDFHGKIGLAVSLHAPNDELRSKIVPINERYPIARLMAALRSYPLPPRRRITIEYTLIQGQNDGLEHAQQLCRLLAGLRAKVNLIPMNPVAGSELRGSAHVERFRRVLAEARVSCSVRRRRGDDVDAACGQLALSGELLRPRRALAPGDPQAPAKT